MTAPIDHPDWYEEMLNTIIAASRDDDEANSETVDALVKRLQELQALGQAEVLSRKINTGNGLAGGGDLSADRTITLSQGALVSLAAADSAVQPEALQDALKPYDTAAVAGGKYVEKKAGGVFSVPFSHPATVNGETTSPPLLIPGAVTLLGVTVAADDVDADLTVTVTGGASASVSVPAGQTTGKAEGLSAAVSGPLRVRLSSSGASGVTVMLKVQEVPS